MKKKFVLFLLVLLLIQLVLPVFPVGAATQYTSVLDDLNASGNFDASLYPEVSTNYSLQVIALAESVQRELFIYVYQPSSLTKLLPATYISIDAPKNSNDKREFRLYELTLLSTQGVFHKYRVEDFVLRDGSVRTYSVSEIMRAFNADLGDTVLDGNEGKNKAYPVGKMWTLTDLGNGDVSTTILDEQVIEVPLQYIDYVKYDNGSLGSFLLGHSYSYRSHFIAFTPKKKMDAIHNADVRFVTQSVSIVPDGDWGNVTTEIIRGNPIDHFVTLTSEQILEINTSGYYGDTYKYTRIQSIADFLTNEGTSEQAEKISDMEWVFRFYESAYTDTLTSSGTGGDGLQIPTYTGSTSWTEVTDVAILRIEYTYDGVTYNLGVVADMITGNNSPDAFGTVPKMDENDWKEMLEKILFLLFFVLIFVFCGPILTPIFTFLFSLLLSGFKVLLKALLWLLTLPFRWLFR